MHVAELIALSIMTVELERFVKITNVWLVADQTADVLKTKVASVCSVPTLACLVESVEKTLSARLLDIGPFVPASLRYREIH